MPRAEEELRQLRSGLLDGTLSLAEYRRLLMALLGRHLACSRVSLWRLVGASGRREPVCAGRWDDGLAHDGEQRPSWPGDMSAAHVERVSRHGAVVLDAGPPVQARSSRLDVALVVNGRTFGLMCCERRGAQRPWQAREIASARRLASTISLTMAQHGAKAGADPGGVRAGD